MEAPCYDGEIVELLKIANGHLPRVRLEYDRLKAELNSLKAEINNSVRIYQDFCDRNVELKNREDELQLTISELEGKIADLQKTRFNEPLSQFQGNESDITNLNPEAKQEDVISTNDVSIPPSNMAINYHPNENETLHYSSPSLLPLDESSSQTSQVPDIQDDPASVSGGNHEILDTGDLSKVYLAYNDITFQIYPNFKISHDWPDSQIRIKIRYTPLTALKRVIDEVRILMKDEKFDTLFSGRFALKH
jgi:FtsZ-binding cell division protein ZapB